MKKLLILSVIVLIGCTKFSTVTQNFPSWTQTQNQRHAYTYQENLKGLTKSEILDRFGSPDSKTIGQDLLGGEQEGWIYGSALGYNRKIRVNFINDIVDSIIYN